jgi:hypothetical protein
MEAQHADGELAHVNTSGVLHAGAGSAPSSKAEANHENRKLALNFPDIRAEYESVLYDAYRNVYRLDPDLAIKKSFSLSAKITYQRQRNVASAMREQTTGYFRWMQVDQFWADIAKRLFWR